MSQILYMWGPVPDLCGKGPPGGAAPPTGDDPVVLRGRGQAATQGSTGGLCGRVLWGVVDPPFNTKGVRGTPPPLNPPSRIGIQSRNMHVYSCILREHNNPHQVRGNVWCPKRAFGVRTLDSCVKMTIMDDEIRIRKTIRTKKTITRVYS